MKKERVIFRREYNKYDKKWGYLAIFPDDEANPGNVSVVPFYHIDEETTIIEPFVEASIEYVLNRKLVHKNTEEAVRCLKVIEKHYHKEFEVVEKMTKRK